MLKASGAASRAASRAAVGRAPIYALAQSPTVPLRFGSECSLPGLVMSTALFRAADSHLE